jgi:transcriptional regulator with XRE-family HTH domain
MSELAAWLRSELRRRELTQNQVAVYAGVGQATISDILNKGHVPKVETLFRLADYFQTPREELLRLAGHLPSAVSSEEEASGLAGSDESLIRALLEEFRQVPDEWKPVAVEQVAQFRRLAELRPVRVIGDEGEEPGYEEERPKAEAAQAA